MARRILIIGFGKMGEAIYRGLKKRTDKSGDTFMVAVGKPERAQELSKSLGCEVSLDVLALAKKADVLLLCVKPQQAPEVLKQISKVLRSDQLVISICAGLTLGQLRQAMGSKAALVRAMPNTPCLIGQGITVVCGEKQGDKGAAASGLGIAEDIFNSLGTSVVLDEALFDGATAISGCGPAYAFMILDALGDAGVKVGLPRKIALQLAAHTLLGSSAMLLERNEHPAALKDEVTTPAGITIDALMALEEGKLRVTLIKAVVAATEKSKFLGGQSAGVKSR